MLFVEPLMGHRSIPSNASIPGRGAEYCDDHCVCLSVSQEPYVLTLPNIVCMLPVTVAGFCCDGGIAIYYVLWFCRGHHVLHTQSSTVEY